MGIGIALSSVLLVWSLILLARGVYMVHMQSGAQSEKHKIYIMVGICVTLASVALPIKVLIEGF